MTHALVFSGGGDYADPWHPYAESSEQLAELIREWGVDVEVADRVGPAIEALADHPDLFVINAGAGPDPHPHDRTLASAAIEYVEAGGDLLVVHLSTGLFPGDDRWEAMTGARWIWDESGHPPHGPFTVLLEPDEASQGLVDFMIDDESYSRLRLADGLGVHDGTRVLASHQHDPDGIRHPLVWVRERGAGRVVVDLLGHDGASFATPGHRELLARALERVLDRR